MSPRSKSQAAISLSASSCEPRRHPAPKRVPSPRRSNETDCSGRRSHLVAQRHQPEANQGVTLSLAGNSESDHAHQDHCCCDYRTIACRRSRGNCAPLSSCGGATWRRLEVQPHIGNHHVPAALQIDLSCLHLDGSSAASVTREHTGAGHLEARAPSSFRAFC